jgi:hypothetical protein
VKSQDAGEGLKGGPMNERVRENSVWKREKRKEGLLHTS